MTFFLPLFFAFFGRWPARGKDEDGGREEAEGLLFAGRPGAEAPIPVKIVARAIFARLKSGSVSISLGPSSSLGILGLFSGFSRGGLFEYASAVDEKYARWCLPTSARVVLIDAPVASRICNA